MEMDVIGDSPIKAPYVSVTAAIVGGRTFCDYEMLKSYVARMCAENGLRVIEVVSGGARGADALGKRLAMEYGLKYTEFPAEWKKYGKSAGFRRNKDIINACDVCFAFWDGQSHGTAHDISLCGEFNKPCYVCRY